MAISKTPIRFIKKPIETYVRPKFNLHVSKKGRTVILKERILANIKKSRFLPLKRSTNLFDILNKKIFVKESFQKVDVFQLKDYLKQRKLVSCIPEVYGSLKLKSGNVYIFSKFVPDSIELCDYLKKLKTKKDVKKLKFEVNQIGDKLITAGLLPWDFKLKQFFYSPRNKKIYLCDNAVAFYNPKVLLMYYKKANLEIPSKLRMLNLLFSLHPIELILEGARIARRNLKKETIFSADEMTGKLNSFRKKGRKLIERDTDKIILNTINYFNSLSLGTKQLIQREVLKDALKEIDHYSR
jgi:hypothetical protein